MNEENKKQVILAGVLGVVLVGVLIWQFLIVGGGSPPSASGNGGSTAQTKSTTTKKAGPEIAPTRLKKVDVDLDVLLEQIEQVTFDYAAVQIRRSPMTPLVGIIGKRPPIGPIDMPTSNVNEITQKNVTGIIYNEYSPVAIIDDEIVSEGHQYTGGVVLTRIEPNRVWFKWGDSEIPVELKEL